MTDQQEHDEEVTPFSTLLALDLEYRLTIASRVNRGCPCAPYLIERRTVLLPAMLEQAKREDMDPADVCHRFAMGLHERHQKVEAKSD